MTRLGLAVAVLALGLTMTAGAGLVPGGVGDALAATKAERAAAREALKAKRAECRREAKAQKLGFIKRERYYRACLKKA